MTETVDQRLHDSKKTEFLRNKTQLELSYEAVIALDATSTKADIADKIFDYLAAYKKILTKTTPKISQETNFYPDLNKKKFDAKIKRLVGNGVLPVEISDLIRQKEALETFNENYRPEGLSVALISTIENEATTTRTRLDPEWQTASEAQFLQIQVKIQTLKDKIVPAALTEKIENPNEKLLAQAATIDWTFLFGRTNGLPLKDIRETSGKGRSEVTADTAASFETTLTSAATAIDADQPLTLDQVKELRRLYDIIMKNLGIFSTQPDVVNVLVVTRTVIAELLDRNQINQKKFETKLASKPEEFDRVEVKQFYLRPTTELGSAAIYSSVAGRDEAKVFIDLIGRDKIDKAEEIGLRIFTNAEKKTLAPQELLFLQKLANDIQNQKKEYEVLSPQIQLLQITQPQLWEAYSKIEQVASQYIDWISFLLKETGNELNLESASTPQVRAPEKQAAQEVWKAFFLNICHGPNPIENMEKWGNTIFSAFYRSATPTESFKSSLELDRFSAWKDALKQVGKERKEVTIADINTNIPLRLARREIKQEDVDSGKAFNDELKRREGEYKEFYYLEFKQDSSRKLLDQMITHGQSRGMTANWHREDDRKVFKDTSFAQYQFAPRNLDFFQFEVKDLDTGEMLEYHYAEQFTWARTRMVYLRKTPGMKYYGRGFKEDDTSKVDMKAQVAREAKRKFPDVDPTGIDEAIEIAYTALTFSGVGLDIEAELIGGGYSPAGLIAARMPGLEIAPIIPSLYSTYSAPMYKDEFVITYPPLDYLYRALMRQANNKPGEDNFLRLAAILKSIRGTQMAMEHHAPLRTEVEPEHVHWKQFTYSVKAEGKTVERSFDYPEDLHGHRPFGYVIDTWSDGMMRWPYPSLYRFNFEKEYIKLRKRMGYTYETWVDGYEAFLAFRKAAFPEGLSVDGKKPEQAIEHLMKLFNALIDTISKIKSNMMVDWNYALCLTIGLCDRMFLALHQAKQPESAIEELQNQLLIAFGGDKDWGRKVKSSVYSILAGGSVDSEVLEQMRALYPQAENSNSESDDSSSGNNKFNSAGAVDVWRMLPPELRKNPPPEEKDREHSFAAVGRWALLDYTRPGRDRRAGSYHLSEASFVHNWSPLHSALELLDHPDYEGFLNGNPSFEPTVNVLGVGVGEHSKTASEVEKSGKSGKH